jgi:hypothetical protein
MLIELAWNEPSSEMEGVTGLVLGLIPPGVKVEAH